jgi:hypothetical protein
LRRKLNLFRGIRVWSGKQESDVFLKKDEARAETFSAEVHLMNIKRIVREHQSRCMVVDPLSAIAKAGAAPAKAIRPSWI